MSKTAKIVFLKEGLFGGWNKDFAHGKDSQDLRVRKRFPGETLEINEGSIDSPILKDLVNRGCVRIIEVDDIPGNVPFDRININNRLNGLEGAQFEILNIPSGGSSLLTHSKDPGGVLKPKRIVQVVRKMLPLGINLATAMTPYDPLNFSTFDSRINDGNLINFWYNNSSFGPAGKWIGLDNGAPITITHAVWYDYHASQIYRPIQYRIDGSNDGAIWTPLIDILNPPYRPSTTTSGHLVDLGGPQTYRYFRWFCVTGTNVNFVIIAEMLLYNVTSPAVWVKPSGDIYRAELTSLNTTTVINSGTQTEDLLVNISGVNNVSA
jgi:hypothetical protein